MDHFWFPPMFCNIAGIYALIASRWPTDATNPTEPSAVGSLPHAAMLAAILGASGVVIGLYRTEICLKGRRLLLNAALAAILAFVVALLAGGWFPTGFSEVYAIWLVKVTVLWFGFVLLSRLVLRRAVVRRAFVRRVLVVGSAAAAIREHARTRTGGRFEFLLSKGDAAAPPARLLSATLQRERIWAILVAEPADGAPDSEDPAATAPLRDSRLRGVRVFNEIGFWEQCLGRVNLDRIDRSWFLSGEGFSEGWLGAAGKRLIDIVVSLGLLILTFPLMLPVALAVKLDSPGPLLYRQRRVGVHGQGFTLLKFRSMRADAEAGSTPRGAARGDAGVTRVGRFIRSTRIDELPQLFNVLKGEMSLVGPRPERPHFVEQLAAVIPFYHERAHVKPGITGWAQVNYPYGASVEDAREKLSYDLYYLKNRSLLLDLLILVSTVRVVRFREGAR